MQPADVRSDGVLITGAGGMLAHAIGEELARRGVRHHAAGIDELDLTDPESVRSMIGPRSGRSWSVVVNCAAWTDVDGAEADEPAATRVNGDGVRHLVEACGPAGTDLIHFSTDYVFDGAGSSPYRTDHRRDPVNAYGRSKLAGELALESWDGSWSGRWLLVRTSWLYAPWGRNFVLTMRRLLRERDEVRVVSDQRGRPTSALGLARGVLDLHGAGGRGVHHLSDGGECTWHELAAEVGRLDGAPGRVVACTTAEFPRPAARPAYSVLDLSGAESIIGPRPGWREAVAEVLSAAG